MNTAAKATNQPAPLNTSHGVTSAAYLLQRDGFLQPTISHKGASTTFSVAKLRSLLSMTMWRLYRAWRLIWFGDSNDLKPHNLECRYDPCQVITMLHLSATSSLSYSYSLLGIATPLENLKGYDTQLVDISLEIGRIPHAVGQNKVQAVRSGNPIFDVIVELDDVVRGRCRMIWDVASAVDAHLSGRSGEIQAEVRFQLLLLTIPFPGLMLNRGIVKFGDVLFNVRIGTLSVFTLITVTSFLSLVAQTYDLQKRYAMKDAPMSEGSHYAMDLQKKATRWRSERNWWISALTFTIYWMLLRFHAVKKQLLRAQRRDD
ncbi:hypothetical protein P43SY_003336 [Pythium insidiosum]|uniref:Transmembrane protein n=1 Tax=Pythium insidiosum TaxID=114742 RepID=A0AAD5Q8J3_PYTIN|nr:hypothetical protein P43SY_003336 [Pythium insidiosum]